MVFFFVFGIVPGSWCPGRIRSFDAGSSGAVQVTTLSSWKRSPSLSSAPAKNNSMEKCAFSWPVYVEEKLTAAPGSLHSSIRSFGMSTFSIWLFLFLFLFLFSFFFFGCCRQNGFVVWWFILGICYWSLLEWRSGIRTEILVLLCSILDVFVFCFARNSGWILQEAIEVCLSTPRSTAAFVPVIDPPPRSCRILAVISGRFWLFSGSFAAVWSFESGWLTTGRQFRLVFKDRFNDPAGSSTRNGWKSWWTWAGWFR